MNSSDLFARAKRVIPGGVNSPVRAFNSVGGNPLYIKSGSGCHMTTEDGQELLDFCGSWGPLVLGHSHPEVLESVIEAARDGLSFGTNNRREVALAELVCELIPSIEMLRLVNSGTEATMTALRLARGVTGRSAILKFDGCYHGHSDSLLVAAGSGLLTSGIASSAGVGHQDTFVVPYNDLEATRALLVERGSEVAAIIVEPIAGNMGYVTPADGFLAGLRELADESGALLIFDEVITGFRLKAGSYGSIAGVTPDITCLGKIIGGGMPIGALGGSVALMENLAPLGPVYQAGTLSGNPVAVAAGLTTLQVLKRDNPYPRMAALGHHLQSSLTHIIHDTGLAAHCAGDQGLFTLFFTTQAVTNLDDAKTCDTERFARYHQHMLKAGIYLSPSQFELGFVSASHKAKDIEQYLSAVHDWAKHETE
ncbi:MAG: glutamate-1-semialdehyde 2,1-aminomutase [Rhodothermales bacterium]|jgi:glutamate-1-semialdehyde 2,1-aminomutase